MVGTNIHGLPANASSKGNDRGLLLLRLKIISAENLVKKDLFGACDPYVKIDLIKEDSDGVIDSVYTKTKKKTFNPNWNEEFIFRVKPVHHRITLEVYDENLLTRHDFLGIVDIPLVDIPTEGDEVIPDIHCPLKPKSHKSKVKGSLQIYVAYLSGGEDILRSELLDYSILHGSTIIHSLYREHYAYRHSMTDVIIQDLITEEKVRIKCRDVVKKLAIYKDRLAIQLKSKVVIYELVTNAERSPEANDECGMHYKVCSKINLDNSESCSLLVVGAKHIILYQDTRLQCLNFEGSLEREWQMESFIRYVRPTGGPPGKEGVLFGLRNGQIVQIFVNNQLPISIINSTVPIRCLDLSARRTRLAVVDDRGLCSVYDSKSKELLYHTNSPMAQILGNEADINVNSVAFNSQVEDLLCYSGSGKLFVKCDNFEIVEQTLHGFVVGFVGSKVFCLDENIVSTFEINQTESMLRFIEQNRFEEAYQVACLNIDNSEWETLAFSALQNLNFEIAKKAFWRIGSYPMLQLIEKFDKSLDRQSRQEQLAFLGDVMAYRGMFDEAVSYFKEADKIDKAINMYTDLKLFDEAQKLIRSGDSTLQKQLASKKAAWVQNINEPRTAAEMYLLAGEIKEAIDIITKHGWVDMLMVVARQLDMGDRDNLYRCAQSLLHHRQYFDAAEVFRKLDDIHSLVKVYAESSQWDDAFAFLPQVPDLKQEVYTKYASFLAEQERFTEAQEAFHKAGLAREAMTVLQTLTSNAIDENRFGDAAFFTWILARQCLDMMSEEMNRPNRSDRQIQISQRKCETLYQKYQKLESVANIYFSYDKIYRFIEQPFTSCFPDTLFNTSRYLYHEVILSPENDDIPGISRVTILYALVKQCRSLGAYKLARTVYSHLRKLHIPKRFLTSIEMGDLTIRGKPFSDAEELMPLCYRCSTPNPLTHTKGNTCNTCRQEFIFSFTTFDVLPLVQFDIEEDIPDEEAVRLIETPASVVKSAMKTKSLSKVQEPQFNENWEEENTDNFQSLKIRSSGVEETKQSKTSSDYDLFVKKMSSLEAVEGDRVVANREILLSLRKSDVFVADQPKGLRKKFFRNLLPDMHIIMCRSCHRFFLEDVDLHLSEEGTCPFCKHKLDDL